VRAAPGQHKDRAALHREQVSGERQKNVPDCQLFRCDARELRKGRTLFGHGVHSKERLQTGCMDRYLKKVLYRPDCKGQMPPVSSGRLQDSVFQSKQVKSRTWRVQRPPQALCYLGEERIICRIVDQ